MIKCKCEILCVLFDCTLKERKVIILIKTKGLIFLYLMFLAE